MPDQPIAARAEQRAEARPYHMHPDEHGCHAESCQLDHRTPTEQREDVLGKLADVWAYVRGDSFFQRITLDIENAYTEIQRTEAP